MVKILYALGPWDLQLLGVKVHLQTCDLSKSRMKQQKAKYLQIVKVQGSKKKMSDFLKLDRN